MLERLFGPSWRTGLSGWLLLVCGSTGVADEISPFLPERARYGLHAFCALAVAFGFIVAKDANVTNAPIPLEKPQAITAETPVIPAPPKV